MANVSGCARCQTSSILQALRGNKSFTDFDKLAYPLVDLPSQLSFSDPFGNIALRAERGVLAVARRVLPL